MARFVEAFSLDKPKESAELISKRLKTGLQLEDELANYFRDRAAVEEKYATELIRLGKKHTLGPLDKDFTGTFQNVWEQLASSLGEVAALHVSFARELAEKMERPLRSRAHTDPDWSKLKQYESEFGRSTKDYDDKIVKYLKATAKAKKSAASAKSDKKTADATAAKDAAKDQWVPQATEAFERFQRMDESRLTALKETLAKYADLAVRHESAKSAISDGVLAATMSFDVADDITKFCSTKGNNDGTGLAISAGADGGSSNATSRENSVQILPDVSGASDHAPTNGIYPSAMTPAVDEEGYTIPPTSISAAWDSSAAGAAIADDEEEAGSTSTASRIKVAIRSESIVESPEDANKALRQFQNVLGPNPTRLAKRGSRRISLSAEENKAPGSLAQKRMTMHMGSTDGSPSSSDLFGNDPPFISAMPSLMPIRANSIPFTSSPTTESRPARVHASISEQVNVLIRGNEVEKLLLMGDVSLTSPLSFADLDEDKPFTISISNYAELAQAVPNETFARVHPSHPEQFEINSRALKQAGMQVVPIIKYQVKITDPKQHAPLLVHPIWKCEPTQTSLMLVYQLNPLLRDRLSLADVSFLVPVDAGGEISRVQTKPSGIWNAERKAVLWKVGKVGKEAADEPQKLLARMDTTEATNPGTVAIRFTCSGALLSNIGVSCAYPEGSSGNVAEGIKAPVELGDVVQVFSAGKYGAI
ncbi:Muniscin C-terminal mu homology domain-containing protein [Powellomyces hirtus]|nr:Muniscin C-terminal mu homology domain-containing protein [Powellomyces hirtus]